MSAFPERFDVIIVGGSYAGMSAALQLARARRSVLVIDAGQPRNRNAQVAHGFLGREGMPPADIAAQSRAELLRYPSVAWLSARAVQAEVLEGGRRFAIACDAGQRFTARRLVLAYGVTDDLPPIDGLAERWGRQVLHCPYCHGYELQQGTLGVVGCSDDGGADQALLLCDWGSVILFCHDAARIDPAQKARLDQCGVVIETTPLQRVEDQATAVLADGRRIVTDALFVAPVSRLACDLAEQLGCALQDAGCITADSAKQTTVEGVFACGDAARMAGNIALSVGEGALAGVAVHHSLVGLLD
ncbi:NAD(P)/FAD-dependent oxidoreductase [Stenotrophomonas sp.]|uniref:NAD(P)/FAD-dependent oxidoreductase n=1 Tax=Stenotrophomonas sp. TaxID=69392 RepID=UPI002FC9494E